MKIMWAFEPTGLTKQQIGRMDEFLNRFAGDDGKVGIVHVEAEMFAGAADPHGISSYMLNRRDYKGDVMKALGDANVQSVAGGIHFVSIPFGSLSEAVHRVFEVTKKQKADLIGLYSQGKKGLERWLLGSFAETFVHWSTTDLLLLNPKVKTTPAFTNIFFLDDFSDESKKQLSKVMDMAQYLGTTLTLFHVPHYAYRGKLDAKNKWVQTYRKTVDERVEFINDLAKAKKVETEVILGNSQLSIVDESLRIARKKPDSLIVVAAKLGRFGALLGGSVTRQLLRRTTFPTYVIKSKTNSFKGAL